MTISLTDTLLTPFLSFSGENSKVPLQKVQGGITVALMKRKLSFAGVTYSAITPKWSDHQISSITG
jgi:hypothetical protein